MPAANARSASPADPAARVIRLRVEAPPRPAAGQPCNGCGVCCAAEPCPLGAWRSGRRSGRCRLLKWDPAERRYACGAVLDPRRVLRWLPPAWTRRLVLRWIAAGAGCDCSFDTA